ncbi:hypothetical protein AVEN_111750-1 [Araneus ventricosus]|uniref:Uncharacterized protein n=1 Tax=Araneus ventricosus TaxID=182803 RepID=A0A4Y2GRB3_ARAVE|nr:hypothetical protein AVEN_111750-1 [Araneus ventricosus]
MSVRIALFVVFVFSGVAFGEDQKNETVCPPTIVDCACTEKDGNFYTIQINTTTVYISDEDTGMDRCIADGDPLALCEDRDCVIIPNDNFATLFRKGRKMSPSNYLQEEDFVAENHTSSSTSNKTDPKPGPGPSDDVTVPFYPIELTYPRMIHGEESSQLVKRDIVDGADSFIPPPNPDFGDEKYGRKGRDPFRPPSDSGFGNEKYRKKGPGPFRPPSDLDFGDEKYGRDLEDARESDTSLLSDSNDPPPMPFHQEELDERPSFRDQSANNAPTYWEGNYGYACKVPQLRNSEVTCWKWPNWQTCKQTCIYGHGIASQKGTLRSSTYTCRNSENQWKPHRMTDCQPYLNCKVRLRSPGDLKCVEPTNRPAYCDIACEEYDNHSAQRVRVTCDEQQGGMRLPFCATLDNSFTNHIRSPSS